MGLALFKYKGGKGWAQLYLPLIGMQFHLTKQPEREEHNN